MRHSAQKWTSLPLSHIAKIERTAVFPENIRTGTTYVGLENMTSSGTFVGVGEVATGELASSKFAFTDKHILYGKLRPYLAKIACPPFPGVCSTDILPILPGPDVDRRFLLHFLRQPQMVDYASSKTTGANLPRLSPAALGEFEIPLPPLSEQKRIADILDKADAIRRKRQEALEIARVTTSSLFHQEFGDPIFNPKEWNVVALGDVSHKITDGVHFKPTYTNEGIPFISVRDITTGHLRFDDTKYVSAEAHAEYIKRCHPEKGDVLLTKVGATYGRPALVNTDRPFSIYVSVALIKPDRRKIDPMFLKEVLASSESKRQADRAVKGAGVPDLHLVEIRQFKIPLPPLDIQEAFVTKTRAIHAIEEKLQAAMGEHNHLFNSLIQRAFTGNL
jgi:type I restriction enzyme S subunit